MCPRTLPDGSRCDAEQEVEVDLFYEGGWCAQILSELSACPDGHQWTPEEIAAVQEQVTLSAVEPREPVV